MVSNRLEAFIYIMNGNNGFYNICILSYKNALLGAVIANTSAILIKISLTTH